MAVRFEGTHAMNVRFSVVRSGEEVGVEVMPEGQVALCFNYDEVFYIEGTVSEVIELLADGINALQRHGTSHPGAVSAGDTVILPDGRRLLVQFTRDTLDGLTVDGRWIAEDGSIDALASHTLQLGDTIE